jgi:leader peptidase (prepilin peptidase) / N-methyltransferase
MDGLVLFYTAVFIFGTIIGSFLNVLIDRIPRNESIVKTRSHCEHCRRTLAWYDLIPVFSYLMLQGRCRYCHKHIGIYYPVVESLTGALFMLTAYVFKPEILVFQFLDIMTILPLLYFLFVFACLIVIIFTDLKYGIIPFKVVLSATIATFLYILTTPVYVNHIYTAVIVFAFFLMLFFLTRKRGLGFGDVVYSFLMGLVLGFPKIIVGLYLAFLTGAIVAVILVWMGRKKLKGGSIPFGPFLVGGTIISIFWGETIITLVMNYLVR